MAEQNKNIKVTQGKNYLPKICFEEQVAIKGLPQHKLSEDH